MAAGEYVSVSSQADTEQADLARERNELATQRPAEEDELTAIYVGRGLEPALARTVALQLMAHDALGAHARDELGLSESLGAPRSKRRSHPLARCAWGRLCRFSRHYSPDVAHPEAMRQPRISLAYRAHRGK